VSQKELQRVAVISASLKGEVACVRAAELLCLSVRQIKRLRKRMRQDGVAGYRLATTQQTARQRRNLLVRRGVSLRGALSRM
jgi:hypothetical protein